jgi:hypothetical protein
MGSLDPQKLHVKYFNQAKNDFSIIPRKYTLTHSDSTGELFLTIGKEFEYDQIDHWYIKLMRDEVLGEWQINKEISDQPSKGYELHLYVHVSGGFIFGWARLREKIFRGHLPLVYETILYGDNAFFSAHPFLDNAFIFVHFQSHRKRFNKIEKMGKIGDYKRTL